MLRISFNHKANEYTQYVGWSSDDAVKHYLARMSAKIPHFETMEEGELNFIKVRDASPAGFNLALMPSL